MRSHRGELRLSNPDWNDYELLGAIRWLRAMLAASCGAREAGTKVQGHGLQATFASIAEELVSSALLKRMMNHAAAGDVTLGHYVAKSEAQLRAGWQAVADFVEGASQRE